MKYKIQTYGCQMNVHESEKIAGILRNLGYEESTDDNFDIVVFNTCCIRDTAEQKILGHIGKMKCVKKQNPRLIIAVVGCMTQQDGKIDFIKKRYPYVDIILGTNNLEMLTDSINKINNEHKRTFEIDTTEKPEIIENDNYYRTSGANAWVNIMYGCNNFCTYCIVPYVRGRERSRKPEDIIREVRSLVEQGYKEITLLGQNVNSYGNDFGEGGVDFVKLLEMISEIEGDYRVRFMTSHPKDLNTDVIDVISKNKNLCKNIHLPIQSGSNAVLKAMNRHYTREDYLKIIDEIRTKMPECGITTDIMVGFPGETEEDFEDTLDIVRRVRFNTAFTYIYSVRKGTKAASMEQIPYSIKSARIQRLIEVQNEVTKELSRECEGTVERVLAEGTKGKGKVCGRTDSGRLVTFKGDESMIGNFYDVMIEKSQSASLFGKIVEE